LAADAVDVCRDCRDVVGYRVPLIAGKDTLFVMQLKINGEVDPERETAEAAS